VSCFKIMVVFVVRRCSAIVEIPRDARCQLKA